MFGSVRCCCYSDFPGFLSTSRLRPKYDRTARHPRGSDPQSTASNSRLHSGKLVWVPSYRSAATSGNAIARPAAEMQTASSVLVSNVLSLQVIYQTLRYPVLLEGEGWLLCSRISGRKMINCSSTGSHLDAWRCHLRQSCVHLPHSSLRIAFRLLFPVF